MQVKNRGCSLAIEGKNDEDEDDGTPDLNESKGRRE